MLSRQDLEIELLNTIPAKYFRMDFDLEQLAAATCTPGPASCWHAWFSQALGDTCHTKALQGLIFSFPPKVCIGITSTETNSSFSHR